MAILQSELKLYRAEVVNDTGTNGGIMSINEAASGVANNLFPDVTEAERSSGVIRYRKGFYKVANDADLGLSSPRVFIPFNTDANDMVVMFAGTQDNIQSAFDPTTASVPDQYGCGQLNANISAAATSLVVAVEDWTNAVIFRIGDNVRISDQATVGGAGNEEFVTLDSVTPAGNLITLTWTGGLTNGYTAASTKVSSVYEPTGPIQATADASYTVTSASGTYNEGGFPVEGDNIGGVYDDWTLTFTSATAFDCVGTNSGAVGSGAIGSDFQPTNGDFAVPYFILRTAGWGGTWATNDTLQFTTQPAAVPLWFKQVVPAGASIVAGNSFEVAIDGQTA